MTQIASLSSARRSGLDVDRERIDQCDALTRRELNDGKLGQIGSLPVKLGIECICVGSSQLIDELFELRMLADPFEIGHGPL